ncbi:MAG: hypothetical protein IT319_04525, partial [Anaerolineae bacterium]|nr:hypothetical protein [Anaerolineae bacterium]
MTVIRLQNDLLAACFDAENGALVSLTHKRTGWTVAGRTELAQSFEMIVPLPERLLNLVDGRKQRVTAVQHEGQRVTFQWANLLSEHSGTLDIHLTCTVALSDEGLSFEAHITNRSPYPVESFAYPFLGDLRRQSDQLARAHMGYDNLYFKSLYPTFDNERGYWGTEVPFQSIAAPESPFVLILGAGEGLYAGCHDITAKERVEFQFRLKPGFGKVGRVPPGETLNGEPVRTEFLVTHFPFVQPGETYTTSPIVLTPFTGDWHGGVDIYKAWRATWMTLPVIPDWLKDVHAWQQLQMSSWGDTLNYRYTDLVQIGKECRAHGISGIQLTGWTLYGQDGRLPIHDPDPRMGTSDELKAALAEVQRMGVKVVLYQKYTCADIGTDWYQRELHRYASRDIFGNTHGHEGWQYDTPAHLAGINTRPYAWMCMNAPEWRKVALGEIEKSLAYQPDGILLDESMWHGKNAFYCFDPTHGHRVPAYNFAGDADFERELVQLLAQHDGSLVLAGEGPYDLQNRHYGLTYHRTHGEHVPVMRYIDPHLPMMNWAYGYNDRENINLSLLYRYIISYEPRHFRGHLDEFPLTLEYGKRVDSLRRRYRSYLWDGTFTDTLGAQVTVEDKPHRLYSVFRERDTGRIAVVVVNARDEEINADVALSTALDTVWVATPEQPEPVSSPPRVRVLPRSAV